MPLRTGSNLAPIAIDPKSASLTSSVPSPPPNPNALESIRGVTGRSCHVDWSAIEQLFRDDDVVGAFALVLERGELEDLVLAMEMLGPRPDVSITVERPIPSTVVMSSMPLTLFHSPRSLPCSFSLLCLITSTNLVLRSLPASEA